MIWTLVVMDLFFLFVIFIIRKDRKERKENLQTMRANDSSLCRQINFLKEMITSSYVMEVLTWVFVGLLTMIILEHFNLI